MKTVHAVADLRHVIRAFRAACTRIAFVPTMGNLHAGHIKLVSEALARADKVIVSIFVNPLQFGPNEDFDNYPRTLEADTAKLEAAGADLLFTPTVAEMYPAGREGQTTVTVPGLSDILDGEFRPAHFSGVATVVAKLFGQVQPDVALFGEKDYQQLLVIQRLVADLAMPIEIVGVPTVREPDGLAMSSRNQYLSPDERAQATSIYRVLGAAADALRAGRPAAAVETEGVKTLESAGFRPDYLAVRRAEDLGPPGPGAPLIVLAAAWLGRARLIDNLKV